MKLRAIRLKNVKKFGPQGICLEGLSDGLSVLAAPNEFGKSTIFESVRLLLHEKHNTSKQSVKAFVPKSGGVGPEIELDFDVNGRSFRVKKRFVKSATALVTDLGSGEVIARDGVADDWVANIIDADNGGRGPTGLLWVEQGTSMSQPEGGEMLLPGLLEAEVGTLVGGERARTLVERTKSELASLITASGKAKAGGPYKSALDMLTLADSEVLELAKSLENTEQVFNDLVEVDRQLEKFDAPEETKRQLESLVDAKRTLSSASLAASEIKAAELVYSNSVRDVEEAEQDLAERVELEGHAAKANAAVERILTLVDETEKHVTRLKMKRDEAAVEESTIEAQWKSARILSAAYLSFERAKSARDKRDEISMVLARAREVQAELSTKRAEISKNEMNDDVLAELEDLSREKDVAQAKLNAGRPSLVSNLTEEGRRKVRLNEQSLGSKEVRLSGTAHFDLAEFGSIEVVSSDPLDLAQASDIAAENFNTALLRSNTDSLDGARKLGSSRRSLASSIHALEREFGDIAPNGLSELGQSLADAIALIPDGFDDSAAEPPAPQNLDDLEVRRDDTKAHLRALEAEYAKARETLVGHEAELTAASEKSAGLLEQSGDPKEWETVKNRLQLVCENCHLASKDAAEKLEKLRATAPEQKAAELAVKRLEDAKANREARLRDLRETHIELRTKLEAKEALGLGEQLADAITTKKVCAERVAEIEADIDALKLLQYSLESAQDKLKAEYFQPVSKELEPLLALVFGQSEVKLSDTYQANSLRRGTYAEDVETLSGGTREQVAVLTRLAFGSLMAKQGRPVPVFLDDALVYCDDDRLAAMFNALHEAASNVQCIVLTCHERAFSEIGGQLLIAKSWAESD